MTEQILGPGSETDQLIRRLKKQNKDKEWSLKTHCKLHSLKPLQDILVECGINMALFDTSNEQEVERVMKTQVGYTKEDIDTLREKLIEDIRGIQKEDSDFVGYDDGTIEYDIVIKLINKRFGVE